MLASGSVVRSSAGPSPACAGSEARVWRWTREEPATSRRPRRMSQELRRTLAPVPWRLETHSVSHGLSLWRHTLRSFPLHNSCPASTVSSSRAPLHHPFPVNRGRAALRSLIRLSEPGHRDTCPLAVGLVVCALSSRPANGVGRHSASSVSSTSGPWSVVKSVASVRRCRRSGARCSHGLLQLRAFHAARWSSLARSAGVPKLPDSRHRSAPCVHAAVAFPAPSRSPSHRRTGESGRTCIPTSHLHVISPRRTAGRPPTRPALPPEGVPVPGERLGAPRPVAFPCGMNGVILVGLPSVLPALGCPKTALARLRRPEDRCRARLDPKVLTAC